MENYQESPNKEVRYGTRIGTYCNTMPTEDNVEFQVAIATIASAVNMLQLNDDCLQGVIACGLLTATDLCSIAETRRKLQDMSHMVFPKKFRIYSNYNGSVHYFEALPRFTQQRVSYLWTTVAVS